MNNLTNREKWLIKEGFVPTTMGYPLGNQWVLIILENNTRCIAKCFVTESNKSHGFHILGPDDVIVSTIHLKDVSGWRVIE